MPCSNPPNKGCPTRYPLTTVVEETIRDREEGNPGTARVHLDRALELAQEMGYL